MNNFNRKLAHLCPSRVHIFNQLQVQKSVVTISRIRPKAARFLARTRRKHVNIPVLLLVHIFLHLVQDWAVSMTIAKSPNL